ncbi:B12-binding domain-containing radical SAM protein [bacterium]|nr:B12-binding domain-containing radical SAM protein [candidate division CSSED10-310 bacterium]
MNVLLISPYSDIASIGLRIIASVIRMEGHRVSMVFLPHTPQEENHVTDEDHDYPESVAEPLARLASESDIVGITVMTNYVHRARKITSIVRRIGSPFVVWGGIHPTIRPEECLHDADAVIRGEGEDAFRELVSARAAGKPVSGIANVAVMDNGSLRINPPRPLVQDLDRLPFPDYGPDHHYVWDRDAGGLEPMDDRLLEKHLALGPISTIRSTVTYQTLATRGCPHRCAYCCNDVLQALYNGQKHLRRRSDTNVLTELREAREKYPFISGIGFSDDSFFVATDAGITRFAEAYKREIDLPFFCLGSPLTISRRKLEALLDAGMYGLQMGVQTGSPRIQAIYQRNISNDKVMEAVQLLNEYKDRMVPPSYDFIIDSPWETSDDLIRTLQLIRQFPRPYRLQLFSLVIFPETHLFHRAQVEGLLDAGGEPKLEYHDRKATYVNIVLGLYRHSIPKFILDFLSHPAMVQALHRDRLNRMYRLIYGLGRWLNRRLLRRR